MTKRILHKGFLFIFSGLAYAFASHYMMKGFNQPFNREEMLRDFLFFGTLMVVLKIVEEQLSKRRKKKQRLD